MFLPPSTVRTFGSEKKHQHNLSDLQKIREEKEDAGELLYKPPGQPKKRKQKDEKEDKDENLNSAEVGHDLGLQKGRSDANFPSNRKNLLIKLVYRRKQRQNNLPL
ncbi:hypothetical protein M1146_04615 [Patescibacteria group bacterium]|nr:hypothetical protein [Patescibacteria group bacterium]